MNGLMSIADLVDRYFVLMRKHADDYDEAGVSMRAGAAQTTEKIISG